MIWGDTCPSGGDLGVAQCRWHSREVLQLNWDEKCARGKPMELELKGLRKQLLSKRKVWSGLVIYFPPYCWRFPGQAILSTPLPHLFSHPKPLNLPSCIKSNYYLNSNLFKKKKWVFDTWKRIQSSSHQIHPNYKGLLFHLSDCQIFSIIILPVI